MANDDNKLTQLLVADWLLKQQQQVRGGPLQPGQAFPETIGLMGHLGAELTGIPQAFRAGSAINETYREPSIANATNAGVQTSMAAMRPVLAAKALGVGLSAALAKQFGGISESQATDPYKSDRDAIDKLRAEQRRIEGAGIGPAAKREQLRAISEQITAAQNALTERQRSDSDAARSLETQDKQSKKAEYERAVKVAETLRDDIRKTDTNWNDTEAGKVVNKLGGFGPAVAAIGAGAAHRAVSSGKGIMDKWIAPTLEGTFAAGTVAAAPHFYNQGSTPPLNPQRQALEVYSRELPEGHPNKQGSLNLIRDLQMPVKNPVRTASEEQTTAAALANRLPLLLMEGASGIMGRNIPDALTALGRGTVAGGKSAAEFFGGLPASVMTGHYKDAGRAATARSAAAEAQATAVEVEAAAREAQRRLGGQRADARLVDDAATVAPPTPDPIAGPFPGQRQIGGYDQNGSSAGSRMQVEDATRGVQNQGELTIPSSAKLNPDWVAHSPDARNQLSQLLSEGLTFGPRGKGNDIRAREIHAALDSPKFKVNTTQDRMKTARDILIANGVNPAKASPDEIMSILRRINPGYFAAPIGAIGTIGALNYSDADNQY